MHLIEQIGAFAGLAAFFGLAIFAFLLFMQSRHVRDLEDKATFVPEGLDLPPAPAPPKKGKGMGKAAKVAASSGAAVAAPDDTEETEQPVEAQVAQTKEAARQVEIARAAPSAASALSSAAAPAPPAPVGSRTPAGAGRRGPEPRAMIVIGLGVAVLVAGIIFATGILGGSSEDSSSGGEAAPARPRRPPRWRSSTGRPSRHSPPRSARKT